MKLRRLYLSAIVCLSILSGCSVTNEGNASSFEDDKPIRLNVKHADIIADVSGNKESTVNINFNHTFEAVQGQTYTFIIFVSSADKFPATFDFVITK